jgi:hypothetical protein
MLCHLPKRHRPEAEAARAQRRVVRSAGLREVRQAKPGRQGPGSGSHNPARSVRPSRRSAGFPRAPRRSAGVGLRGDRTEQSGVASTLSRSALRSLGHGTPRRRVPQRLRGSDCQRQLLGRVDQQAGNDATEGCAAHGQAKRRTKKRRHGRGKSLLRNENPIKRNVERH